MASRAVKENAPIRWGRNRGRNGWDVPTAIGLEMSALSINIDLVHDALGRRRNGSIALTFTTGFAAAMLARFQPGQDDAANELHLTTRDNFIVRVVGATPQALVTVDGIESLPQKATAAQLNGKLYWAYNSAVNRLHVYDPSSSTTTVRRAGLSPPTAAPSAADAGSGTYPAVLRYYRVRWQRLAADGTLAAESEPSAVLPWTPANETFQGVTVGRPGENGEGETHWRVEASADNKVFFTISFAIPLATLSFFDTMPVPQYASQPAAPLLGTRSPWPSVKFLAADAERLLGFGVWETATASGGGAVPPHPGRVYYGPVIDSSDQDDDERLDWGADSPGFIDVGRNRGYEDRALIGPLDSQFFAFQSRGVHKLVPTGDNIAPYQRVTISNQIGAVSHWSCFIGEDANGNPCLYFLDPRRGPYRYGSQGLEWIGYDVQDVWATVNLDAADQVAHGYFDENLKAAIWFVATGTAAAPNRCLAFFAREGQSTQVQGVRYGFSEYVAPGWFDAPWSSLFFSTVLGTKASRAETGFVATASYLYRLNIDGAQDDFGVPFQAYVRSGVFQPGEKHIEKTAGTAYVQATAHGNPLVVLEHTLLADFDRRPGQHTLVSLKPEGAETRVLRKVPELYVARAIGFQVQIGDPEPLARPAWTLDDWTLTFEQGDER